MSSTYQQGRFAVGRRGVKRAARRLGALLGGLIVLASLPGCNGPGASMIRTGVASEAGSLERVYVYSFTDANLLKSGVNERRFLAAIEAELASRGVYAKAINAIWAGKQAGKVVYQNHSYYSDGRWSAIQVEVPVSDLIALHAEDEKKDNIAHRITIVPRTRERGGSIIVGNYVGVDLSVYSVGGRLLAFGWLHYQYRVHQDEATLAKLLVKELENRAFLSPPASAPDSAVKPH